MVLPTMLVPKTPTFIALSFWLHRLIKLWYDTDLYRATQLYDTDLYRVKRKSRMKIAVTPKDKLFQTAARLFYQHGYRAVGVDTIAAESGIGKMTLYRHYPSKDDLIVAFLRDSDENFWRLFRAEHARCARPTRKNYWLSSQPCKIMWSAQTVMAAHSSMWPLSTPRPIMPVTRWRLSTSKLFAPVSGNWRAKPGLLSRRRLQTPCSY